MTATMRIYPDAETYESHGKIVAHFAAFDAEALSKLPPKDDCSAAPFEGEILDTRTGKVHSVKHKWAAYEEAWPVWDDEAKGLIPSTTLMPYFYGGHWCGCHRISSIEESGGRIEWDDAEADEHGYCPNDRFVVLSLRHPALPGVVLMREEKK